MALRTNEYILNDDRVQQYVMLPGRNMTRIFVVHVDE